MNIHCKYDELVDIAKLKPYPKNRNKHTPDQITRLAFLLREHGVRAPVIVATNPQKCIAKGHGTLDAMKQNGWTQAPVVYQDFDNEDMLYAFVQSDNAIASWAELDLAGINADLSELGPFDLDLLGIENFVADVGEFPQGQGDPDEPPEVKDGPTICQPGDLWTLGDHRLLCGDSTKREDVERLMGGEKADLLYTDPPYGQLKIFKDASATDSSLVFVGKNNAAKAKKYHRYQNEQIFKIEPFLEAIDGFTRKMVIWGGNYFADVLPITTSWVCWDKRAGEHCWFSDFELAWTNLGIPAKLYKIAWQGMIRETEKEERVHPTQKPIALHEWIFRDHAKEAKLILDGYLGSGSTLIACEKTNRKCYGMEIDPHYCDVIIARWEKFSGKKAVKL